MQDPEIVELIDKAREVSRNAYAPYSHFPVGVALKTSSGQIFTACNVENASFGLTVCAERNAIAAMVAAGQKDISTMVIYTPTSKPVESCGACRQSIWEFSKDTRVISVCDGSEILQMSIAELLPSAFTTLYREND